MGPALLLFSMLTQVTRACVPDAGILSHSLQAICDYPTVGIVLQERRTGV